MKRYTSVMALAVRALLGKVLAVTTATAVAQLVLTRLVLRAGQVNELFSLQQASWTPLLAVLGLAGILALMALHGSPLSGVRTGYTLRRLPLSEKAVTILWAVVYLCFLVLFWAAEVGVSLLQQRWAAPLFNGLTVPFQRFADNYSSPFFHSLLPLYDWPRHLHNVVWLIALAWGAAAFSYYQRRGSFSIAVILILILGALFFQVDGGTTQAVWNLLLTFLMGLSTVWSFFNLREEEEDNA